MAIEKQNTHTKQVQRVDKGTIWREISQFNKDMITDLIQTFNARPIRIVANGKGWKP